ncbi:hypothetical protein BJX76DRAFT_324114 [Aspergillus varians]
MSQPSLSSSNDELRVVQENEKQQPPTPRAKPKKKQGLDPVYIPQEDEPDSPAEDNIQPVPGAQKRKLEVETIKDEVSLPDHIDSPPLKKPSPAPPSISITGDSTTGSENTENAKIRNAPLRQFVASSGASSISSNQSSLLPTLQPTRKRSVLYEEDGNYVAESDDEDRDIEELESTYAIHDNEKANVLFDFHRERDKRLAGAVNIPKDMYTEREKSLFLQLAMRGFEPLAPKYWQFDFPTLPDSLFPESGTKQSEPIIKVFRGTGFYAIKSLGTLFSLSGRVRDCSIVEKRPEALITQTIKKYIRWALYDVNLEIGHESLPTHLIHAQRKYESIRSALERLNKRMKKLARRHQKALAEASATSDWNFGDREDFKGEDKSMMPLLVGFLVCGPVVALMTFDLGLLKGDQDDQDIDGRFFSQFDFSERGQDVWNSLSIAIVVMHIRNTMVQLSQNNYGGFAKSSRSGSASEDL